MYYEVLEKDLLKIMFFPQEEWFNKISAMNNCSFDYNPKIDKFDAYIKCIKQHECAMFSLEDQFGREVFHYTPKRGWYRHEYVYPMPQPYTSGDGEGYIYCEEIENYDPTFILNKENECRKPAIWHDSSKPFKGGGHINLHN